MSLAAFEAFYSRPIAPTRRLALGEMRLPTDETPGHGAILLGGIAARFSPEVDPDLIEPLYALVDDVEAGLRIAQPRIRHRLQDDKVGLQRCQHFLIENGGVTSLVLNDHVGTAAQNILCAIYAAGDLPNESRVSVMAAIRKGLAWRGDIDDRLLAHLGDLSVNFSGPIVADPVGWAISKLDFDDEFSGVPERKAVQQAYRVALREAHPDHGAPIDGAADRIAELVEARRILLRTA